MSVASNLMLSVAGTISGLTLPFTPTVARRKRLEVHEKDSLPLILVVPETESEEGEDESELSLLISYPFLVAIIVPSDNIDTVSMTNMQDARETIRRALRSVNAVADPTSPVINVRADLDPAFDRSAVKDNLDVSAMTFTYTVQEPRIP